MGVWIFASVCVFSVVFLYTKTQDKWNWKRIWGISWKVALTLIVIPPALLAGYIAYEEFQETNRNKPKLIDSLKGVKLGDKFIDINIVTPLTEDKLLKSIGKAHYNYDSITDLMFDKQTNTLVKITQVCSEANGDKNKFTPINGIYCSSSPADVVKKYGKENIKVYCQDQSKLEDWDIYLEGRIYNAPKFGVSHFFAMNELLNVKILFPNELKDEIPKGFKTCD